MCFDVSNIWVLACPNSFEMNKVLEFGALLASGGQVIISNTVVYLSRLFCKIYLWCNFF